MSENRTIKEKIDTKSSMRYYPPVDGRLAADSF